MEPSTDPKHYTCFSPENYYQDPSSPRPIPVPVYWLERIKVQPLPSDIFNENLEKIRSIAQSILDEEIARDMEEWRRNAPQREQERAERERRDQERERNHQELMRQTVALYPEIAIRNPELAQYIVQPQQQEQIENPPQIISTTIQEQNPPQIPAPSPIIPQPVVHEIPVAAPQPIIQPQPIIEQREEERISDLMFLVFAIQKLALAILGACKSALDSAWKMIR